MSGRAGLSFLKYNAIDAIWQNWRTWPGAGLAQDLASDNIAAYSALTRHFDLNIWDWPDIAHGAKCSFEGTLHDLGIWDFGLLFMITWSLDFGEFMYNSSTPMSEMYIFTRPASSR